MTAKGEDNYETAYKFFDFEIGSKEIAILMNKLRRRPGGADAPPRY
jgi:hypothetical protein